MQYSLWPQGMYDRGVVHKCVRHARLVGIRAQTHNGGMLNCLTLHAQKTDH